MLFGRELSVAILYVPMNGLAFCKPSNKCTGVDQQTSSPIGMAEHIAVAAVHISMPIVYIATEGTFMKWAE
jgi:hypothetical protein